MSLISLQSFSKSEEAWQCAALLGAMGLHPVVVDERSWGGNSIASTTPGAVRVEVPEEELETARELLASSPPLAGPVVVPGDVTAPSPVAGLNLPGLLRALLLCDLALFLVFSVLGQSVGPRLPPAVEEFLLPLAGSDGLWALAYGGYWPLMGLGIVAAALSWFYLPAGRLLYLITIVWSLVIQLGPPPMIIYPWAQFLASLQWVVGSIALSLMYWSPLKSRFGDGDASKVPPQG